MSVENIIYAKAYVRAVKNRNAAVRDLVASFEIRDRKGFVDVKILGPAEKGRSGLRVRFEVVAHLKTEI